MMMTPLRCWQRTSPRLERAREPDEGTAYPLRHRARSALTPSKVSVNAEDNLAVLCPIGTFGWSLLDAEDEPLELNLLLVSDTSDAPERSFFDLEQIAQRSVVSPHQKHLENFPGVALVLIATWSKISRLSANRRVAFSEDMPCTVRSKGLVGPNHKI